MGASRTVLTAGFIAFTASVAHGQAFNVSFGPAGSGPAETYAAAGAAGTWNRIAGQASPEVTYHLVATDGSATDVTLTQTPSTTLLAGTDPSVSGDDSKLLNSALVTYDA